MPAKKANGITIAYESFGRKRPVPIILLMGLGAQLAMWPEELVERLVDAGHQVIMIDNRDVGLSQKMHGKCSPNPLLQSVARIISLPGGASYDLKDMAGDIAKFIDALSYEKAHLVGVSMGE